VLPQVLLQYRRDSGGERHSAVAGVGLGLADHPPTLDPPHGSFDADAAPGKDVGPAESRGLAEPEAAEGENQEECAVALGSPVSPQLFCQLAGLGRGERAGGTEALGVPAPRSRHGFDAMASSATATLRMARRSR
jgi:hypothetical protein